MSDELELRLLRHFIVVAEELHFSRAAERLFIAQQALSRDIRRLEERVGTPLFDRSTRRVALTQAGRRLLPRAKELLGLHDLAMRELREEVPLVVDVVNSVFAPARVLDAARRRAPELEFFALYGSANSLADVIPDARRADVSFGWLRRPGSDLRSQSVRYERLAVLIPETHGLAALDEVPLEMLRDTRVCSRAGDHVTAGWVEATSQLLAPFGIDPTIGHPPVPGGDELAQHLRVRQAPILALMSQPPVADAVLRPIVDPIPLYPWTMTWRADVEHEGVRALREAAAELAASRGWLDIPDGAWLLEPGNRTILR
ncbi:LysR family transcriptional regulator [Microbacterium murale]|uniref:DNA-binding transcriptional LysR family regulator n=1 Tax=Microbacterium murale TaxID=1081040 RepID=A0ABU0PAN6_9MICO|nr:LysR family transcriptional regulator [Microbacterium murale]MDQ0644403.1 DNA-binding transcriptional LysR family regulator [Microbacterium murale]